VLRWFLGDDLRKLFWDGFPIYRVKFVATIYMNHASSTGFSPADSPGHAATVVSPKLKVNV
jgi:hypothetical protein